MRSLRKYLRFIAAFMAVNLLVEIVLPVSAYALTSGPSQPEVQSFEPIGTSEMVDVFSGDFTYNIPLLDIEGYPINISYNSGVTMDQEASWVGLGWNINPGVVNRNMRGLPDDFDGDMMRREMNVKDNITVGLTAGVGGYELFGIDVKGFKALKLKGSLSGSLGLKYNNYKGVGFEISANLAVSASNATKGKLTGGLGLKSGDEGLTISPTLSFSATLDGKQNSDKNLGGNVGVNYNSRAGLQSMSYGLNLNENPSSGTSLASTSSSLSFGTQTYSPSIGNQMVNATYTLSVKLGTDVTGQDITGNLSGYFSSQRLANPVDEVPAYGYMNLHKANNLNTVNLDFNREKDGPFTLNTPSLPLTNLTFDIYSVAGQGIGGSYRMFRNDLGYVYDPYEANTSISGSLGLEAAPGGLFKGGFDLSLTDVNTYARKWQNPAADRLQFRGKTDDPLYEAVHFRESGEKSVDSDPAFYESMVENKPVRFDLSKGSDEYTVNPSFVDENGVYHAVPEKNYRSKRQKRNQVITYMTRGEMKRFGLEDQLQNTYNAPDHHIGQITTLRPDGARYIFGIPAYNTRQEETSFNTGKIIGGYEYPKGNAQTGLVRYRSMDNSRDNNRGIDHYYSNSITPAFAHSYLLTAVLSADYVDIDNERGPSPGDMGTFTRFHYTKLAEPYKWRTPFEQFQANWNEGMKSQNTDDQGNYVYGEKEIWYVSKIETKNYIAIFHLEDRKDAYSVKDKNGGRGNVSMKKLTKISLYSRFDFENSVSPVPIKEVHFEYDYSLCAGIPNNSGVAELNSLGQNVNLAKGKLTLKRVYFTYNKSYKAKYNSYDFTYSAFNPVYSAKAQDRWGNYKPNNALSYEPSDVNLTPAEFPYVSQNQVLQDQNATAWNLTRIDLPSGGQINVEYESDDYAYVQDKQAMEMFIINNVGSSATDLNTSPPTAQELFSLTSNNLYVFFKLKKKLDGSVSAISHRDRFYREYLRGVNDLYFRFLVDIGNGPGGRFGDAYEYVSGYAEIEDYGVHSHNPGSAGYEYAYVKLKGAKRRDNLAIFPCNPISKASWNFGQMNLPRIAYQQIDPTASGVEQLIMALTDGTLVKNLLEVAVGTNNVFWARGNGKHFKSHKSWIRLNSPDKKKLGGGSRVKRILLNDRWNSMVPGQESTDYGQEYDYTTTDPETGNIISSGVASYEPQAGGDENPFKQPVYHGDKEEKVLAPDDNHYMEEPFGESFFPSAGVGYSVVTVKNFLPDDPMDPDDNITRNATGKVVHEFYTAKDFPTITRRTDLKVGPYKNNPLLRLFTFQSKDYMSASQGFVVELNDMHGKPKGQKVYAQDQSQPISGIEYVYQADKLGQNTWKLNNEATVVNTDGTYETKNIGLDYDFVADMRSQISKTYSGSGEFNLATIPALAIPIPIPTAFPSVSKDETRFKSATTTKVINRSGLLKETIAYDLGASVSTKNLAYDAETGEVLLTQTINNFNDPVFTFNYPAHWYYDGMGQAYKNIGLELNNIDFNGGQALLANAKRYFVPGDELSFNGQDKVWVTEVQSDRIIAVNEFGNPYESPVGTIKVMRSGRRNLQSLAIGSLTTLSNPLEFLQSNLLTEILQANSVIYSDEWKTYCDCFTEANGPVRQSTNPYVTGQKGVWRNTRSYLHLTNRSQSYVNNNSDIRKDGTFTSFNPFWKWGGNGWSIDDQNWTWTTTITQFNPNGQELENEDALHRYSAGLYAYNNTLTVGVAANSRLRDLASDGFEDYSHIPCSADHFSYRPFSANLNSQHAHTGTRSLQVGSGESITITKPIEPCSD